MFELFENMSIKTVTRVFGVNSLQVYSKCHKYVREYNCRIHFTPCKRHRPRWVRGIPCRELCYEVHKYCPDVIKKFGEIDTCKFYPSVEEYPMCYQPKVSCPQLSAPSNGSVEVNGLSPGSEAKYSCNLLFDLKGNTTRICLVIQ